MVIGDIIAVIGFVRGVRDEQLKLDATVKTNVRIRGIWHYKLWVLNSGKVPYTLKQAQFVDSEGSEKGRIYFDKKRLEIRDVSEQHIPFLNSANQDVARAIVTVRVHTECGTVFDIDFSPARDLILKGTGPIT